MSSTTTHRPASTKTAGELRVGDRFTRGRYRDVSITGTTSTTRRRRRPRLARRYPFVTVAVVSRTTYRLRLTNGRVRTLRASRSVQVQAADAYCSAGRPVFVRAS